MKTIKLLTTLFCFTMLFITINSCVKKDSTTPENVNSPTLIPENNNKSLGRYSGTFTGSVGFFQIDLRSIGSIAILNLDGVKYDFIGQGTLPAEGAIIDYVLTSGDKKITISVNADGSTPTVLLLLPGHSKIAVVIVKELTTSPTEHYLGTYENISNKGSGTARMTLFGGDKIFVSSTELIGPDAGSTEDIWGTYSIESITGDIKIDFTANGNGNGSKPTMTRTSYSNYRYSEGGITILVSKVVF